MQKIAGALSQESLTQKKNLGKNCSKQTADRMTHRESKDRFFEIRMSYQEAVILVRSQTIHEAYTPLSILDFDLLVMAVTKNLSYSDLQVKVCMINCFFSYCM